MRFGGALVGLALGPPKKRSQRTPCVLPRRNHRQKRKKKIRRLRRPRTITTTTTTTKKNGELKNFPNNLSIFRTRRTSCNQRCQSPGMSQYNDMHIGVCYLSMRGYTMHDKQVWARERRTAKCTPRHACQPIHLHTIITACDAR